MHKPIRRIDIFFAGLFIALIFGVTSIAERLTITSYYPSPYGAYKELRSTGKTLLATTPIATDANSKVGIGVTNPTVKLDVAQNNAIKVGQAYLSSGGNYAHLANNEWFNG
ncbi:hypothetical protein ACFL6Y_11110, partial [Elusimicrobiota bacterium]